MTTGDRPHDRSARILIVGDGEFLGTNLATSLKAIGHEIAGTTASANEAVVMTEQTKPDLVLMDIHLSCETNVIEIAAQIQSRFGIPVMFLVGGAQLDNLDRSKDTRPSRHLGDPASLPNLKRAVEAVLCGHRTDGRAGTREERYDSLAHEILDSSAVGVFILDADFKIVWLNRAMELYFGLRRSDVLGIDKRQFIRDHMEKLFDDPRAFADRMLSAYDDNTYIETVECHVLGGDGREERWLDHWSQPIWSGPYAGGRIEHYYDITERKRAEDALRESELRYRSLFEDSPISVWEEDFSQVKAYVDQLEASGVDDVRRYLLDHPEELWKCASMVKVVDVNQAALNLYGAKTKTELFESLGDVLCPESMGALAQRIVSISEKQHGFQTESVNRNLGGDPLNVLLKWTVAPGHEHTWSKVLVSIIDITERKRIQEALRDSEDRYRQVFDLANEGVVVAQDDRLVLANPKALEITGYTEDELLQKPLREMLCPEDRNVVSQDSGQWVKGVHAPAEYTLRIYDKTANMRWVKVRSSLINWRGSHATLAMVSDVTEEKRLESGLRDALAVASRLQIQTEAAGAAKSEFLAAMSHELRTPLHAIIGFSELLEAQVFGTLNDRQMDHVKEIFSAGRHLLGLIDGVLDLARVAAGGMDLVLRDVPLKPLLEDCLNIVLGQAREKRITLDLILDEDVGCLEVGIDEAKIRQVICNLLSNAVKFTPDGGEVRLEALKESDYLVIAVSDTGIGIRPEDYERVFKAFVQLDSALDRKFDGTGLGLALSKTLVELHGGKIWLESQGLGKGSTFKFRIPL